MLELQQTDIITQAAKTSLAAALALALAGWVQLPEPYWAAISAIMVMQSDIAVLQSTSLNRLAGTAIGALVGACAVSFWGLNGWSFPLAVFCSSLICAVIGRWETYRFAGVTVAIVMLVTHHGTPWIVGLHRFLEVSFGIIVAFVITFLSQKWVNRSSRHVSQTRRRFPRKAG